jgi:diadenosine tetraphosphate (Ap4A) HIT family hydrolase
MEDCWFCKSKGDTSLIIYEGRFIYVSLEKGPLCRFHLQFIPFNHVESSGRLDREEVEELQAITNSLKNYFTEQGY